MRRSNTMTIGQLSKLCRVPIKTLRTYEGLGFLSTRGRSEGNYRLFGEETLWCVQVVQELRSLGLTLKEIQALVTCSGERESSPMSVLLEARLRCALARVEAQMSALQALRQRILEFQDTRTSTPARPEASALARLLARNSCCGSPS